MEHIRESLNEFEKRLKDSEIYYYKFKNKKKFIIPVSKGLLDKKHKKKLENSIWEFLWLIDKITKDVEIGDIIWGIVLGGKPIKAKEVAKDLGESNKSARRNLKKLENMGYVRTIRAPNGKSYEVKNSIKWKRSGKTVGKGK